MIYTDNRAIISSPVQSSYNSVLISVIIPVYNVEKYLAKCIDSIISQTYNNLEILLIDDGSTDSSGSICDSYASRDSRIRVIHQPNKGLAEVRNIGSREAKGEYIQFVDSDDWIDPETIATCFEYACEYDADIVCFRTMSEYEDGSSEHTQHDRYAPIIMDRTRALSVIFFPQYVDVITCNKLIKSTLLKSVHYPSGKLYEDMSTTYKIIHRSEKVLAISNEFYHYLKRKGSIGHMVFSSKTYGLAEAAQRCYDYIVSNTAQTKQGISTLNCGLWFWKIVTANYMIKANSLDKEYISKLRGEISFLDVMRCPLLTLKRKIQLLLFKYNQTLYRMLYMRMKKS